MKPVFRLTIPVLVCLLSYPVSTSRADIDPSAVPSELSRIGDTAYGSAESEASASSALGQFPQAESMPIPPSPGFGGRVPTSDMAAMSAAANAAAGSESAEAAASQAFPKVQTPQDELMARKFSWWPTDAKPAPVKDAERSGYWWWPDVPGEARPWGNQGYVYVRKIIYDYKSAEGEMKPSLVIKRIIKNVKVYFDYDKSELRDDTRNVLSKALYTLRNNPQADILVTGNADIRGSEQYNLKLGERRAASVQEYLASSGLAPERIRILSRGKLDALAPTNDLVGMQQDRNAQFVIAEVEEVMIPAEKASLFEDKRIEEQQEITGEIRVSTKDYVIRTGDTLWGIAKREYGDGRQWKRIYEFNKDVISNPNRPKKGTRIQIPIE